jgi:hypothetical protein
LTWIYEIWATAEGGEKQALKISLMTDEKASRDEIAKQRSDFSGMFRRRFDEWPSYQEKEYER